MTGVVSPRRFVRRHLDAIGVAAILLIAGDVLVVPAAPDPPDSLRLPSTLSRFLDRMGFDADDYQALEAGRAISRLLETSVRDQLGVVAVVRVDAPVSRLLTAYHDIVRFESDDSVLAMGVFSAPAVPEDVTALQLTPNDLRDLRSCRVGDCDVNLPGAAIERFRRDVDWSSATAAATARRILQETLVAYVERYRRTGNDGLVVYHDSDPPMPIGPRSLELFRGADALAPLPRITRYFEEYNAEPLPPRAETFLYWQQITFGMKPVTRINHVVMAPFTMDDRSCSVFVSRMIYASHYFRDGLELRYVVPVDAATQSRFYLVLVSRSHSESLVGFKGFLIGGAVRRRVRNSMATYATHVKARIEAQH
jgi:hypothetical protein